MSALEQRAPAAKRSPAYTDADLRALGLTGVPLRVALYAREAGHFRRTLRPAIPNREVAARLGVSLRTVQRAKVELEKVGIVPARAGRYSGYHGPQGRENLADVYVLDRRVLPALGGRHLALVPATSETRGGDNLVTPYEEVKHPTTEDPSGLGGGVAAPGAESERPPAAPATVELAGPAAPAETESPPAEPAQPASPPDPSLLEPELSMLRAGVERETGREGGRPADGELLDGCAARCIAAGGSPFKVTLARGVLAAELGCVDVEPTSPNARRKAEYEAWADDVDWDAAELREHYELGDGDPPAEQGG